jgi:hypothetical protein
MRTFKVDEIDNRGGGTQKRWNYTSPVLFKWPGLRRFTINALLAIFSLHYETKTV